MPEAEGEAVQLFVYDLSGGMARAFSQMLLGRTVRTKEKQGRLMPHLQTHVCKNSRQPRTLVWLLHSSSSSFSRVLPTAIHLPPWHPPSHPWTPNPFHRLPGHSTAVPKLRPFP